MLNNEYLFDLDTGAALALSSGRYEVAGAKSAAPCQINKKLSVFHSNNEIINFGISKIDIKNANLKVERQRKWLENQNFISQFGQIKSLLDCSLSANISPKYYAELNNRVNTIQDFCFNENLKTSFLTITLNGCFRDALLGDFSRFKLQDKRLLPYYLAEKLSNNEAFTIKDLVNLLNHLWFVFVKRIHTKYKNFKKYYIRAFEPHKKDGVPHIHALLSYPEFAHDYILKTFKNIFYAPQNLKTNYLSKEQVLNGEINGFQWTLNNPSGYILKYINKSFVNFNKSKNLNAISSWYVKHKVRRFISSRHQIPLWIYRKINFFFKDFYNLCTIKNNADWICEWDIKKQYFRLENVFNDELIHYENGIFKHSIKGVVLHEYQKALYSSLSKKVKITFKKEKLDFKLKPLLIKFPNRLKNYDLMQYYISLGKQNTPHFALVENEIYKRLKIKKTLKQSMLDYFNIKLEMDGLHNLNNSSEIQVF